MIDKINYKKVTENLIPIFDEAGKISIDLYEKGLKIKMKDDKTPVSNGDLKINDIISKKIMDITPEIPIISEETVNINEKNLNKIFWLIDPIDGTREYIAGKDEYTINAALIINQKPIVGLVGAPRKGQLFYTYGKGKSFVIEKNIHKKVICKKNSDRNTIKALSSIGKPSELILETLKNFNVSSIDKVASSYKFCLIAYGSHDIYAAKERANEWDYAAGHAVAENAGAIITTLDGKPFLYGKEDYRNPSLLILRSKDLND